MNVLMILAVLAVIGVAVYLVTKKSGAVVGDMSQEPPMKKSDDYPSLPNQNS